MSVPATYITHARNAEELRKEVISDIHRRIDNLTRQEKLLARSRAEKSRLEAAVSELQDMLAYWTEVQIEKTARKRSFSRPTPVANHDD